MTEIRLKYFDTVPVASAMCVLKTGFLFVASEFGNQYVSFSYKKINPNPLVTSTKSPTLVTTMMIPSFRQRCLWKRVTLSTSLHAP